MQLKKQSLDLLHDNSYFYNEIRNSGIHIMKIAKKKLALSVYIVYSLKIIIHIII